MRITNKYHLYYYLIAISFIACQNADHKDLFINHSIVYNRVNVNPGIEKETSILPLMIKHFPDANYLINEKNIYCNFLDDTIIILLGKSDGWAVYRTEIKMVGPEFSIFESYVGCVTYNKYSTILQELACNKSRYRIGDTLIANISYMGVYYPEGDDLHNDTIYVEGAFRSIIRDTFYTFQKLNREDKYRRIKRWAHECPDSITSLSWNFDTICTLPIELMKFTRLYNLDLRGTDLKNADLQVLAKIPTLINLDLGSTNLREVPSGILSLGNLVRLKLDNNNIAQIPDGIYSLTRLSILNLTGNQIIEISDSIYKLRRLLELRIDGNPILHLPDAIAHLKLLNRFFPPENLDFLPLNLVDVLEPGGDYSSIGNFSQFKDDVPKIGEYHVRKYQEVVKFLFPE